MFLDILSYGFMQKAFIAGIVISIACSLLGVFLVLRKYSLFGDGLAHISFGGVALGLLFNIMPILTALFFAVISSLGILKLKEKARIHGDTAIGIVSHTSLGLGIFIASIASGFNVDILSYLFGNILTIGTAELVLSIVLAVIVVIVISVYYHELVFLSFDEESARTSGVKVGFLNALLIVLTAITVVSLMRIVGLLLAAALIILPAASSLQIARSFKSALIIASMISVVSVVLGLFLSYQFDFATSGTIVLLNSLIFLMLFSSRSIFFAWPTIRR